MVQCCDITAASLKTLITIERRTRISDNQGGWTENWIADPLGGVWAMVTSGSGSEGRTADRLQSLNSINFFVRFRGADYDAPYWNATETRILFRGRYYNITSVIDLELQKKWIRLSAIEGEIA